MKLKVLITCSCPCLARLSQEQTLLTRESWDLGHPRGLLGWGQQDQVLFQLSTALWEILIELHFSVELNELKDCELYYMQSWLTSFSESWEKTLWSLFSAFLKRTFFMFSKGSFAPQWPNHILQNSFEVWKCRWERISMRFFK